MITSRRYRVRVVAPHVRVTYVTASTTIIRGRGAKREAA